jgi:uncharacterized membrane protein
MNSTLRLLIVALAMLGAFLIGASSGAGTWAPVGFLALDPTTPVAVSLNTRTGQFCFALSKRIGPDGSEINAGCSKEAK